MTVVLGQCKTPVCQRPMEAYCVGMAPHILDFSTRWSVSRPQLLYSQYSLDRKMDEPLIWTGCFVDKLLAPASMCNPGSSSLYPLHCTDNVTQTPTLLPFNSDLNLICVPCNMAHINTDFRKVWWEFVWYFSLLRNLRNTFMWNKIINPVLLKSVTLWNTSK